jgi:hypothetical protein
MLDLFFRLSLVGALFGSQREREIPRLPGSLERHREYRPSPDDATSVRRSLLQGVVFGVTTIVGGFGALCITCAAFAQDPALGWLVVILGGVAFVVLAFASVAPRNTAIPAQLESASNTPRLSIAPRSYTISLPRGSAWQPETAWHFIEHLIETAPYLTFQIVAEANSITWRVLDWRTGASSEAIIEAVHAYYPSAEVRVHEAEIADTANTNEEASVRYRHTLVFQQAGDFVWPIKYATELNDFDPLIALTQALSSLEAGERIVYSLVLSDPAHYAYREGEKLVTSSRVHPLQFLFGFGIITALWRIITNQTREERYRELDQRIARAKLNSPLYQCFLAVQIESPSEARVEQLRKLDTQVWQFHNPPYNALVANPQSVQGSARLIRAGRDDAAASGLGIVQAWLRGDSEGWQRSLLILSPQELASLWHLPHEGFTASGIRWASRRVPAPASVVEHRQGVLLGTNSYRNRHVPVHLPYADRDTHLYVVGRTGMGKSTLLHQIIHQDIAAGKGVGVIDPHGSLVRDVLACSIPEHRERDVVLVDFANTAFPPPLNPFAVPEGTPREVVLSHLMGLLKKIFAEEWSRTRMEAALYSALVALLYDPQATPHDISRLFLDPLYRNQLLAHVEDPAALEYWAEYNQQSIGMQKQIQEPVLNRIRVFYRNAAVRNMVCHPQQLNFRQIIDDGKIFLANLNSDATRTEQANLGALLMTNFQLAAMSRAVGGDATKPSVFYLFVDEVQEFVTSSLPEVLSAARKFGLSMTAANQFLGQLRGESLDAVLGNVGTTIAFGVGPDDARTLAPFMRPEFAADDLVNLNRFHVALKMHLAGQTMPAFSMRTPDPLPIPRDANERIGRLYRQSIERYTPWSRMEVEEWLQQRYQRPKSGVTFSVIDYD